MFRMCRSKYHQPKMTRIRKNIKRKMIYKSKILCAEKIRGNSCTYPGCIEFIIYKKYESLYIIGTIHFHIICTCVMCSVPLLLKNCFIFISDWSDLFIFTKFFYFTLFLTLFFICNTLKQLFKPWKLISNIVNIKIYDFQLETIWYSKNLLHFEFGRADVFRLFPCSWYLSHCFYSSEFLFFVFAENIFCSTLNAWNGI